MGQASYSVYRQVLVKFRSKMYIDRAIYMRANLMIFQDNFSYFSLKPYIVTRDLTFKTVQMKNHFIGF